MSNLAYASKIVETAVAKQLQHYLFSNDLFPVLSRFWKSSFQRRDILRQVKQVIPSFRCYDNSDAVATLIMTNFHLYLIQLLWQFFQNFVYGDVVYAQTWQVFTLKNCIEPPFKQPAFISKATLGDGSFTWAAPKLWNALPFEVRDSKSLDILKSKLKTHLFL